MTLHQDIQTRTFVRSRSYQLGRETEGLLKELLRKEKYLLISEADNSESPGAPMARGGNEAVILPDFLVMKKQRTAWAEVKHKTQANWRITHNRYEHCVNVINYNHYMRIQRESGLPVYLFIYEQNTGQVLFQTFDKLYPNHRYYHGPGADKAVLNFDQADFIEWGRFVRVQGDIYAQLSIFDEFIDVGVGNNVFELKRT